MDWMKCSIITLLEGFESRPTTARLSTSHTRATYFPKACRRLYATVLFESASGTLAFFPIGVWTPIRTNK